MPQKRKSTIQILILRHVPSTLRAAILRRAILAIVPEQSILEVAPAADWTADPESSEAALGAMAAKEDSHPFPCTGVCMDMHAENAEYVMSKSDNVNMVGGRATPTHWRTVVMSLASGIAIGQLDPPKPVGHAQ